MSVQITVIPHKVNQGVFATVVHLSVEAAYVLGAIILHLCKTSAITVGVLVLTQWPLYSGQNVCFQIS